MAKRILNWSKSAKIFAKIVLMMICCAGLVVVPFLIENLVVRAASANSKPVITEAAAASFLFCKTLQQFAGFLVLMLIINLVFFTADECRNDLVKWRRRLQVVLNICVVLTGLLFGIIVFKIYFEELYWWQYLLLSPSHEKALAWALYLAFVGCSILQLFWDVWLFGPENRSPLIAKWLHRLALKQELVKDSRS